VFECNISCCVVVVVVVFVVVVVVVVVVVFALTFVQSGLMYSYCQKVLVDKAVFLHLLASCSLTCYV